MKLTAKATIPVLVALAVFVGVAYAFGTADLIQMNGGGVIDFNGTGVLNADSALTVTGGSVVSNTGAGSKLDLTGYGTATIEGGTAVGLETRLRLRYDDQIYLEGSAALGPRVYLDGNVGFASLRGGLSGEGIRSYATAGYDSQGANRSMLEFIQGTSTVLARVGLLAELEDQTTYYNAYVSGDRKAVMESDAGASVTCNADGDVVIQLAGGGESLLGGGDGLDSGLEVEDNGEAALPYTLDAPDEAAPEDYQ